MIMLNNVGLVLNNVNLILYFWKVNTAIRDIDVVPSSKLRKRYQFGASETSGLSETVVPRVSVYFLLTFCLYRCMVLVMLTMILILYVQITRSRKNLFISPRKISEGAPNPTRSTKGSQSKST